MPFAVQLFFDTTTDAAIRYIWRELAEDNIAPYLHTSANRPHLTLALYEQLMLAESDAALAALAAELRPLPIYLAHLGMFPPAHKAVVFCAPIVTLDLLAVQVRIHALLDPIAQGRDEHYVPGNWVPHCSLATHCAPERALDALAASLQLSLPRHGSVTEIGVTQTSPARLKFTHVLRREMF